MKNVAKFVFDILVPLWDITSIMLNCNHVSKKHKLTFSCKQTGDYSVVLCDKCHAQEDAQFLIKHEKIGDQNYSGLKI